MNNHTLSEENVLRYMSKAGCGCDECETYRTTHDMDETYKAGVMNNLNDHNKLDFDKDVFASELENSDNTYTVQLQKYSVSEKDINILKELHEKYPETIQEYQNLMFEDLLTFARKQHDYGSSNISVGQDLKNEKEILIALTGLWFRMNDKNSRLFNIIINRKTLETTNESVSDAYLDTSVYGKIGRMVLKGIWGK